MKLSHSFKGVLPNVKKPVSPKQHAVRLALESLQMDLQIQELDQKADAQLAQLTTKKNLRDVSATLKQHPEFKEVLLQLVDENSQLDAALGMTCSSASAESIASSIDKLLADAEVAEAEKEEKEVKIEVTVNVDTDKEDEKKEEVTVPVADDTGVVPVKASTEGDLETGKLPDAADKISTKEGDVSDDPILTEDPDVLKAPVVTDPKIVTPDQITAEAVETLITEDDNDDADESDEGGFDDDEEVDIVEGAAAEVDQVYDFTTPAETVDGESMEELGDIKVDDPEVVAPVVVKEVDSPGTEKPNTDVKPITVPAGDEPAAAVPEKVETEGLRTMIVSKMARDAVTNGLTLPRVVAMIAVYYGITLLYFGSILLVGYLTWKAWSTSIRHLLAVVKNLMVRTKASDVVTTKFETRKVTAFQAEQQMSIITALDKLGVLFEAGISSGFQKLNIGTVYAQFNSAGLVVNPTTGKAVARPNWLPLTGTYGSLGYNATGVIAMGRHIENLLVNVIKTLEAIKKAKEKAKAQIAEAKANQKTGKIDAEQYRKKKAEAKFTITIYGKLYRLYVKEVKKAALFYVVACKRVTV